MYMIHSIDLSMFPLLVEPKRLMLSVDTHTVEPVLCNHLFFCKKSFLTLSVVSSSFPAGIIVTKPATDSQGVNRQMLSLQTSLRAKNVTCYQSISSPG